MNYLRKVINYSLLKYLVFALNGFLFFLISKKLGPVHLGYYGFYTLLFSYMNFLNFGSIYALNKDLSIGNVSDVKEYVSNVFNIIMFGFSIIVFFSILLEENFYLEKYEFSKFYIFLIPWWLLFNVQSIVVNIYRAKGEVYKVGKVEYFFAFFKLGLVLFLLDYDNNLSLQDILIAIIIALSINIAMHYKTICSFIVFRFDKHVIKHILSVGMTLLIYEMGYVLLISIDRIFISSFYTAENMGEYTFAFTLNNFTFLFLTSFAYIVFPKVLKFFYSFERRYQKLMIVYISKAYFLLTVILVMCALLIAPLVFSFYQEYTNSFFVFNILLLSNVIYSIAYWINSYKIALGNQKTLIAILSKVLIATIISNSIVVSLGLDFTWISIVTLVTIAIYSMLLIHSLTAEFTNIFSDYLSLIMSLIYFSTIYLLYIYNIINYWFMLILLFIFLVLTFKEYKKNYSNLNKIVSRYRV